MLENKSVSSVILRTNVFVHIWIWTFDFVGTRPPHLFDRVVEEHVDDLGLGEGEEELIGGRLGGVFVWNGRGLIRV